MKVKLFKGLKKRTRFLAVQRHTLTKYEELLDQYIKGEIPARKVSRQAAKLKRRQVFKNLRKGRL